jgi:hypothetical protein
MIAKLSPAWGAMTAFVCGLATACGGASPDATLPSYTIEQTDSTHPGYRRTTVSRELAVYVNDFEEQSLLLRNVEPREAIGRYGLGGRICAIAGQDPGAYVAVDVGSEMPAFEVYRSAARPPFDWRRASFQKMRLDMPVGPAANKETTDAAVIDDVLRTLRDGVPADPPVTVPPMPIAGTAGRVHGVLLFSDDLPGLIFRPWVYFDESGRAYFAPNAIITFSGTEQTVRADWIPAAGTFARWAQMP